MATWLVTGGAGFIGSHIVDELLDKGEKVIVLDNLSSSGNTTNIKHALNQIRFVKGDIRDAEVLKRILKSVDFVSHQAALRSVPRSVDDPLSTNDVNITGSLTLLWECLKARVKRVIYASSSSTYGDSPLNPQKESQTPAPISPYAVSKLAAEHYARVFTKTFGLETVSLRYFNVFGPRQDPRSRYSAVVPLFMKNIQEGKPFLIHGDGRQSRDFTYVKNVAEANWLAARARKAAGENFNVAGGESHSVLEVARLIAKLAGLPFRSKHLPVRKGDVRVTCADPSKSRRILGWTPSIPFHEGMSLTWDAFEATFGRPKR
jgi:nucleoside-diphosphate-sugar epimerase